MILAVVPDRRTKEQLDALAAHHRAALGGLVSRVQGDRRAARPARPGRHDHARHEGGAQAGDSRGDPGRVSEQGRAGRAGRPRRSSPGPANVKLDRLGLARWIVDPDNPLTARVAVNRLWQEIFGIGLVETSEEFGIQGEPPSHPELLDWLATEYIRLGWDTKRLLKLIVTSATYRQSSRVSDQLATARPVQPPAGRGPRVRLPAEAMRDQALFVAGLLSPKMYGPPVHPLQPVNGLTAGVRPSTDWETSRGDDGHRRALYTHWRRNLPYPSMLTFDAPERTVCSVPQDSHQHAAPGPGHAQRSGLRRGRTGPGTADLDRGGPTTASRADFGVRIVLARPPTEPEARRLVGSVRRVAIVTRRRSGPRLPSWPPSRSARCRRDGCRRGRRLDGRRQCAAEPRRDARQALTLSRSIADDRPDSPESVTTASNEGCLPMICPTHAISVTTGLAGTSCATARSAWAGSPWLAARQRGAGGTRRDDPLAPKPPHFPAKVKNVIFLSMSGGPPHLDLFDYKPELVKRNGQDCPDVADRGQAVRLHRRHAQAAGHAAEVRAARQERALDLGGAAAARRHRRRPDLHQVDAHRPVQPRPGRAAALHRLAATAGRPSMGSWVTYGLGSESRDLPGFIVLVSGGVAAQRRQERLGQRLSAVGLPGRAVPHRRRSGALRLRPRRAWTARSAGSASTPCAT